MTFTIPDLTPDTRPWRIDWFGEVAYPSNSQRHSQPVYRVLISPVLGDPSSPNIVTDDGDQREAWLPIGTLPMVGMGDIWQDGEKIIQPNYHQDVSDIVDGASSGGISLARSAGSTLKINFAGCGNVRELNQMKLYCA